jgi:hypothetical protein
MTTAPLDHLLAGSVRVRGPGTSRGRTGRLERNHAAEYDWLRDLSDRERRAFGADLLTSNPLAPTPDVLATMTGYGTVDHWAAELVRCWQATKRTAASELTDRPNEGE